jgi:AcrR family transcriptional regulator
MTEPQDPVRQQLAEARRNQILDGAARVFAEKGYHNATNKDIAEAAGVSYGMIYHYFANKADLLIGILNRLDEMELRADQLEAALALDFPTALAVFMGRHVKQYQPNLELFKAILPEVLVNPELRALYYQQNVLPTQQMLTAHLQARIERGELRPVNAERVAHLLQQLLLGGMLLHLLGEPVPEDGVNGSLSEVVEVLLKGLTPPDK